MKPMESDNESELAFVYRMALAPKSATLLPMNIWVDEARFYVDEQRSKRIKFQLDKRNNAHGSRCGDMDFEGNIHPADLNMGALTDGDITALRNFIRNNRYALEHLADEDVRLSQIFPNMIKGGEPASDEQINELKKIVDKLVVDENTEAEKLDALLSGFQEYKRNHLEAFANIEHIGGTMSYDEFKVHTREWIHKLYMDKM